MSCVSHGRTYIHKRCIVEWVMITAETIYIRTSSGQTIDPARGLDRPTPHNTRTTPHIHYKKYLFQYTIVFRCSQILFNTQFAGNLFVRHNTWFRQIRKLYQKLKNLFKNDHFSKEAQFFRKLPKIVNFFIDQRRWYVDNVDQGCIDTDPLVDIDACFDLTLSGSMWCKW